MLLRRLVLENFGAYQGVQAIDLVPKRRNGSKPPVVLIGGKNGAGKSTIFEAILLCLYGRTALGERASQREYLEHLFRRMHCPAAASRSACTSITLEFDFVMAGVRHPYEVTRCWSAPHPTSASLDVALDLRRNGDPLDDLDRSHWDYYLRELIPPGVSQLFFFDGERIQSLAEQDPQELGRIIKSLLNLDLVDRLHADLQIYLTKHAPAPATDPERAEIAELERLRGTLAGRAAELRDQRQELQASKLDHLATTIDGLHRRLRSEGEELARVRDKLQSERGRLMSAVEQDEERLRELSCGTLPFALCPSLAAVLSQHLHEVREQLAPAAQRRVSTGLATVLERFVSGTLDGSAAMRRPTRQRAAAVLLPEFSAVLRPSTTGSDRQSVDHLSTSEIDQVRSWLESATHDTGPEATRIRLRLEGATRRLQQLGTRLAQAPAEESLHPIIAAMNDAHKDLGAAQREAAFLDDELNGVRRELAAVERQLQRLTDKVENKERAAQRAATVRRSQAALKQYLVAVTALKLRHLETEVTDCIAALFRKDAFVHHVRIDPESFEITLLGRTGRTVRKDALSAGEKQVLAVALLWALSRTSGRPLPVVIDTPLARLDTDHRTLLVEKYLPSASHQVIVLSTDTEVDEPTFAALQPAMSHAYHLRYDQSTHATTAEIGYFWKGNNDSSTAARQVFHGGR